MLAWLWLATLLVAVLVSAAGGAPSSAIRGFLGLRLSAGATPAPTLGRMLALAAHNLPVVAWPLLLAPAGADRSRRGEALAEVLVLVSLAVNALLVGCALGAYGVRLLAFVPQLPLEWAALAAGASVWLDRGRGSRRLGALRLLCVLAVLVLGAAALETFAVPHSTSSKGRGGITAHGAT